MADQSILREYLVSLGFQVNETEGKKVDKTITGLDKKATSLAKAIIGVGTATAAMVHVFAFQMEKLYYASKRTDSAVGNIQALEYGAKRIGLSGETIRGALEGMAAAMRSNPGLEGLLNSLGVRVTGRDKADVMLDLIGALKKMPSYVAERYANLFGMDATTLFMMQDGLEELRKAGEERKKMAADLGVDSDAAAKAAKEYANTWREITERAGLFRDALAISILPAMREMATITAAVLGDWTRIVGKMPAGEFWQRFREGVTGRAEGGGVVLSPEAAARTGKSATVDGMKYDPKAPVQTPGDIYARIARAVIPDWMRRPEHRKGSPIVSEAEADRLTADPPMGKNYGIVSEEEADRLTADPPMRKAGSAQLFAELERRYGLPAGLLDKVWNLESRRGKYMLSPKGAKGHMGFMDATAAQYGVSDPNDLTQAATGSAKFWADLLKGSGGDLRKAAAGYNWGIGNIDRYGLGRAPKETRDYMDAIAGPAPTINQYNTNTVTGVSDPREAAGLIMDQQQINNADLVRNFKPRVQ